MQRMPSDPLLTAIYTPNDGNTDILPLVSELIEQKAYDAAIQKERGE